MKHAPYLLLYDDECPLCTFQMKVLTWLDWRNVLALRPLSHPQTATLAPALTREDLLEAIHCLTPNGQIHRGARAIRFIGLRLPLLVPVALFLWIPGVIWIAELVYRWVSRNRHLLSRLFGCKQACALMPTRKKQD
jgi:predicted DCC family thiol-disulfide oxidoreductase YuxK